MLNHSSLIDRSVIPHCYSVVLQRGWEVSRLGEALVEAARGSVAGTWGHVGLSRVGWGTWGRVGLIHVRRGMRANAPGSIGRLDRWL
jgi:hypothetical protein